MEAIKIVAVGDDGVGKVKLFCNLVIHFKKKKKKDLLIDQLYNKCFSRRIYPNCF